MHPTPTTPDRPYPDHQHNTASHGSCPAPLGIYWSSGAVNGRALADSPEARSDPSWTTRVRSPPFPGLPLGRHDRHGRQRVLGSASFQTSATLSSSQTCTMRCRPAKNTPPKANNGLHLYRCQPGLSAASPDACHAIRLYLPAHTATPSLRKPTTWPNLHSQVRPIRWVLPHPVITRGRIRTSCCLTAITKLSATGRNTLDPSHGLEVQPSIFLRIHRDSNRFSQSNNLHLGAASTACVRGSIPVIPSTHAYQAEQHWTAPGTTTSATHPIIIRGYLHG